MEIRLLAKRAGSGNFSPSACHATLDMLREMDESEEVSACAAVSSLTLLARLKRRDSLW